MKDQALEKDYFRPGTISIIEKCAAECQRKVISVSRELSGLYVTTFILELLHKKKRGQGNEISCPGLSLQDLNTLQNFLMLLLLPPETEATFCLCSPFLFITLLIAESYITIYQIKYEILICYWKQEVCGSPPRGRRMSFASARANRTVLFSKELSIMDWWGEG